MKSIKPGRAPSAMSGCMSLIVSLFGILWIAVAASFGAPVFFVLFGVIVVLIGIAQAIYQFVNAGRKNRFSEFDITEDGEEPDPFDQRFYSSRRAPLREQPADGGFCPYCGARADSGYAFCRQCGRELPPAE